MIIPVKVMKLNREQEETFVKYFQNENEVFAFEGMWFRNQEESNKELSGWKDLNDARRRYLHFYDEYSLIREGEDVYLGLSAPYLYVLNTFLKEEADKYYDEIVAVLKKNQYQLTKENTYSKDNLSITISRMKSHIKDEEYNNIFPDNYENVEIVICKNSYNYEKHLNRMWKLSTKKIRKKVSREKPKYVFDICELFEYLPAQIEMGCGPSIETGIPPLHVMHELYNIKNAKTNNFCFGNEDFLVKKIIDNPIGMYQQFSESLKKCISVKITEGYEIFNEMFKRGYFVGTVLNNNFDRILKRYGIDEKILRVFDMDTYYPVIDFFEGAKSLICIGSHADRRKVLKQAREKGLQVIYIDPEGFYDNGDFNPYLIEETKSNDIIYKATFETAMKEFKSKLLK